MEKSWKKLLESEKVKNLFRKENLIVMILGGILLMVVVWPVDKNKTKEVNTTQMNTETIPETTNCISQNNLGYQTYGTFLETELENFLSSMDGVGKVSVMLTFHSSDERIILKDEQNSVNEEMGGETQSIQTQHSENTITYTDSQGNELPYQTTMLYPKVEGVVVVAQGADNPEIVVQITEVIQALFDLEIHKIRVVTMKSE